MSETHARRQVQSEGPEDQALFDLVELITDRLHAGRTAEAETLIAAHPEWADRLTPMLPALEVLADLGHSSEKGSGVSPALLDPFVPSSPLTGTLGDYRIVRELGRGGMGVVYEAEEISLRRRVALKVFPFATILDPRQLQRFKNEALAAAQLKHAHIVSVFAVGCERGVHFLHRIDPVVDKSEQLVDVVGTAVIFQDVVTLDLAASRVRSGSRRFLLERRACPGFVRRGCVPYSVACRVAWRFPYRSHPVSTGRAPRLRAA